MYIDGGVHIMLDLETMGTSPDAAIVSIGAMEMDFQNFKTGSTFYRAIRLESSMRGGGVVDGATIMWWLKQNDPTRLALYDGAVYIGEALSDFEWFLRNSCMRSGYDSVFVWGNGAGYDNVVLRRAYERIDKSTPWHYRNDRCFRTLLAIAAPELQEQWRARALSGAHHALEDATAQANMLLKIFKQGWGAWNKLRSK